MRENQRTRIEQALSAAEKEFRETLIAALRRCAGGAWGLFGQTEHIELPPGLAEQGYTGSGAGKLLELGREIEDLRDRLGIAEPFPLLAEFRYMRGRQASNGLGEARLAQEWLSALEA